VFFHLLKKNKVKLKVPIKKQKSINTMANYTAGIISNHNNLGYLKLQSFYNDLNNENSASSYEDVKKALKAFNERNVKHLIFDLRGNGGGLLVDGIKIAGLFIKQGPIVQIKAERDLVPKVDYDPDPTIFWDKPVTVLIDNRTASAAEIVAAALQDYNRALILGNNSFGKGSVQQVIDLNKLNYRIDKENTLDATLKLTTQRFYRISGESIQWSGVTPDISVFSSNYILGYEKDLINSLNSDKITTSIYDKWNHKIPIQELNKKSEERIKQDIKLNELRKDILEYTKLTKNTNFEINFDYLKSREEQGKNIDNKISMIEKKELKIDFIKHEYGKQYNTFFNKIDQKFKDELEKDIQFQEILNIVKDWSP
jgi:carboxyl-terminal processing protease